MIKRLAITFGLALVLLALPLTWSTTLRDISVRLVRPLAIFLVRQNAGLSNSLHNLQQIPTLRNDKSQLQSEIIRLQQELSDKESILRENQALRKEVGVTGATKELKKALAHIVLQGSDPLDTTFTIDIGSDQGVQLGQAAIVEGSLVGRVISVRSSSAIVRSVLSKESRIQVWVAENREKGLLVGDGSSVSLRDITQGVTIGSGNIVETSGLASNLTDALPQSILIGTIGETTSKASDLSQSFSVRLAQNPSQIESLFIILTGTQ